LYTTLPISVDHPFDLSSFSQVGSKLIILFELLQESRLFFITLQLMTPQWQILNFESADACTLHL
jgi:hypothetical protein